VISVDSADGIDRLPHLLLVTEYFPWNFQAVFGAFQRLGVHLQALRELGTVDVVFFWPEGRNASADERLAWERAARSALGLDGRTMFIPAGLPRTRADWLSDLFWACRGALGFFRQVPSMRTSGRLQAAMLRDIVRSTSPDLIFAHRMGPGATLLRSGVRACPIILDMDDIEHVKIERLSKSRKMLRRAPALAWSLAARYAERRVMSICSAVLVCSEFDRERLNGLAPPSRLFVLPNSATDFGELPPASAPTALFVGIARYGPNRDAILQLATDIWPRVRSAIPDARLLIVGEASEKLRLPDEALGIEVLGFLPDLEDVYAEARLVVCPVRRGSGTRIKIIEATINGRAVVSTTVGAEGLAFEKGKEILLADDTAEFAARCIEVLSDPARARDIGEAAQRRARSLYSRKNVKASLVSLLRDQLMRMPHPASIES
jgi:glycosyltransferase involved in cell wall biosynthesis